LKATQQYRSQHSQILELVKELETQLHVATLTSNPTATRAHFAQLSGKLMYHFAVKEGAAYPHLLAHSNHEIRDLAGRYSKDMQQLRDSFQTFMRRWVHSDLLRRRPRDFINAARVLFDDLRHRMESEDRHLYTLIDETEHPVSRSAVDG
jgi:hypothetical protein